MARPQPDVVPCPDLVVTGSDSRTGVSPGTPSAREEPPVAVAVVACGALVRTLRREAGRRRLAVEIVPLPAALHNRPSQIPRAARAAVARLRGQGRRVALAYADCGTYGALDACCEAEGLARLPGASCYELLAGRERLAALYAEEPGTYLLTDYLVRSFATSVVRELGIDRHPELFADYFRHYRRLVWLAEERTPELERAAAEIQRRFDLPLEVLDVGSAEEGTGPLGEALETLVAAVQRDAAGAPCGAPAAAGTGGERGALHGGPETAVAVCA